MSEKTVIIIGAGLAGLAAGCYAQMNGYSSHIFEHHSQPGGVAAAWRRGEYLIDGGIHFVMCHKPGTALYELYQELGVVPACRFVDLLTYGRFTEEASGRSVLVTHDLGCLADTLKAQSPADARIVDGLIAGARAMQGQDMSTMGMGKPPEVSSPLEQLGELWAMRRILRYFTGKHGRTIAEYTQAIQDPWLRQCINYLFLPEVPVWFIYMLLALLADGQMGLLEGGCPDFVLPMERRFKELGGQITYGATVEEILVQDDIAVGVRLADPTAMPGSGHEHRADAVISAADGYGTIFGMLGGRYINDKIRQRYLNWKLCRPFLLVSFGVARQFPDEPAFSTLLLEHPIAVGRQTVEGLFVRILNYGPRFAPPGKTVVQAEFEAEWDYWNDLQREDRAAYEAAKRQVATEILERLEVHYPGLSSQVEVVDVATPYTTWRYTLNQKGAWGGWLLTPDLITARVERTLPGLKGFVMAGQWVMPGGGVPSALYSGRHAVQILCRQDGKPFRIGVP